MKPTEIMPDNEIVTITSKVVLARIRYALAHRALWELVSSSVWRSDEGSKL